MQPGGTRQRAARVSSLETAGCGQPHPGHPGPRPPRAPPRGLDPQPEAWPPACAGPSLVHWPGPWKPLRPHRCQRGGPLSRPWPPSSAGRARPGPPSTDRHASPGPRARRQPAGQLREHTSSLTPPALNGLPCPLPGAAQGSGAPRGLKAEPVARPVGQPEPAGCQGGRLGRASRCSEAAPGTLRGPGLAPTRRQSSSG